METAFTITGRFSPEQEEVDFISKCAESFFISVLKTHGKEPRPSLSHRVKAAKNLKADNVLSTLLCQIPFLGIIRGGRGSLVASGIDKHR